MDEWTVQIASAGFQDRIRKARTYSSRATKRFLARHKSDFAERPDEVVRGNLSVASYRPHSLVKYFPGVEVTNGSKLASYQYLDALKVAVSCLAIPIGKRLAVPSPDLSFEFAGGFAVPSLDALLS